MDIWAVTRDPAAADHPFPAPYSVRTLVDELRMRPMIVADGRIQDVDPLSGEAERGFPEPIGPAEGIYTLHSELATLPAAYPTLREQIPLKALITIDNEYVVRGELPEAMGLGRVLRISALPSFLKTYVDRVTFSFTDYLRNERDSSTELHQWIRRNYTSFRELEFSLLSERPSALRGRSDER